MNMILSIAAGGAVGALLRHFVGLGVSRLSGTGFPWATLSVNILGSLMLGILAGLFAQTWEVPQEIKAFLTIGLLGGFTTFSAFSLDAILLWERGNLLAAASYVLASVVFSLSALCAGLLLVRAITS